MVAQLNVQRLCQIIANQLSISNNDDYGLFALYDACETLLHGNECPLTVRLDLNSSGKAHFFAYKRIEAKIAWPSSAIQLAASSSLNQPIQGIFGSAQSRFVWLPYVHFLYSIPSAVVPVKRVTSPILLINK